MNVFCKDAKHKLETKVAVTTSAKQAKMIKQIIDIQDSKASVIGHDTDNPYLLTSKRPPVPAWTTGHQCRPQRRHALVQE